MYGAASSGVMWNVTLSWLDVDFVVSHVNLELDEPWGSQLRTGKLSSEQAGQMVRQYNNIVKQIRVEWVVNKPA